MKIYILNHIGDPSGLSAECFNETDKISKINLDAFESLSDLISFRTPMTDKFIDNFRILTMKTGRKYFLRDIEHERLWEQLV